MKERVGFDLDGVLADIVSQLVQFAKEKHGISLLPEQITSEHAETCTPLTLSQLEEVFRERTFFTTMPPLSGAQNALRDLRGLGLEVDILTDRFWYQEIRADTKAWLADNGIPCEAVPLRHGVRTNPG